MSEDKPPAEEPRADRRAFLRRLTGEAVNAAGTLAGTTQIVIRSAAAASEAAAEGLGIREPVETAEAAPADISVAAAPPVPPPAATVVPTPPPPLRQLTDRETALLSATSAVIAVTGPDGFPHLTRAAFHWDGEVARLLGHLFGARIANVQRNGRITVLIEQAASWLTLSGEATVVAGPAAQAEAAPLLAHVYSDEAPDAAWARLEAEAMQAVIVLRPTRVLSSRPS